MSRHRKPYRKPPIAEFFNGIRMARANRAVPACPHCKRVICICT